MSNLKDLASRMEDVNSEIFSLELRLQTCRSHMEALRGQYQKLLDVEVRAESKEISFYELELLKAGKYVPAIKALRLRTGLGLKESKEVVDRYRGLVAPY